MRADIDAANMMLNKEATIGEACGCLCLVAFLLFVGIVLQVWLT